MKRIRVFLKKTVSASMPVLLAALLVGAGCESDKNVDDAESYFDDNPYVSNERVDEREDPLNIAPSLAVGNTIGQALHFKAEGGVPPYQWSMSNAGRGTLSIRGGNEVIYEVRQVGDNEVIVTDRRGHSALAQVTGSLPALTITTDPATLNRDGDMSIVSVAGGVAPYTWRVEFPSRGNLLATTGASVSYIRNAAGDNVIIVTDASGASAHARISQP